MNELEVPENDLPDTGTSDRAPASSPGLAASGSEVPSDDLPQNSGDSVPESDLPESAGTVSDYTTPEQETKAALEGAAQGIAGPVATWAETHLLGVNPQDIAARQESNPLIHGGAEAASFAGSLLTGTGEAALFAKIGEAASKAAEVGKIGSTLIKGAIEGGMFQGADEISKSILGQQDPQDSVSSALWHTGAAALMGGAGGVAVESFAAPALAKIGESKMGTRFSQFLSDMGSRLKFNQETPDMVGALTEQIENRRSALAAGRDDIYGSGQMKAQNIAKLTQDVTQDQVDQHIGDVTKLLLDSPDELQNDAGFKRAAQNWKNKVTDQIDPLTLQPIGTPPSAGDVFMASDQLKREVQKLAKFGYTGSAASVVADQAKPFSGRLADMLENQDVWNKAGLFQKGLNEANTEYIPNEQNFLRKFTEKDVTEESGRSVSEGSVNTYLNQIEKPAGATKRRFLQSWIDSGDKYLEQVNALHEGLGLQTPLSVPPVDVIRANLGDLSPGAQAADRLYHLAIPRLAQSVGGTAIGGEVGYKEGGIKGAIAGGVTGAIAGAIAPHLEAAALTRLRQYAVPSLIRVLSSGAPDAAGAALNYAAAAAKGASKLSSGIDAIFKVGGTKAIDAYASDSDKEKLHNFVQSGELARQIQKQTQEPPPAPNPVQYFAKGGEVKNPLAEPASTKPADPVLKSVGGMARGMPEHSAMFAAAKSRVNDYLNSVMPQKNAPKLAFDDEPKNSEQHRSYQKALDLAANPLGILNHIKAGTLTPETLKHFGSLWPELHGHLSKKLSEKIVDLQMKNEKPSYRVRQSMSLFLGSPLDSSMTPQAIQSIQAVYAPKPSMPQGPQTKPKKNTSKLGDIPKDHYTQTQAAAERATAWD